MTAPTAGLVQVKVFVRFSVVPVRFMRVRTRLPWVFDEITTPVEKQFGPSPMDGKTERAADPLRENALAPLLGDVEEGKVLGACIFGTVIRNDVTKIANPPTGGGGKLHLPGFVPQRSVRISKL